jgi:3-oxoadipate enol-lactonase
MQRRLLLSSIPAILSAHPLLAQEVGAPLRIVVPFPPGGSYDVVARLIQAPLAARLRRGIVIENRGGAGGNLGAEAVARATPDGNTVLLWGDGVLSNAALYRSLPWDPLRDFAPVAMVADSPVVIAARAGSPSLAELIATGKRDRRGYTFGTAGNGSPGHIAGALLGRMTGVEFQHIPYRGGAPALTDLMGGQIDIASNPLPAIIPFIQGGQLVALAAAGERRMPQIPDTPTVGELLPGFAVNSWYGVLAPVAHAACCGGGPLRGPDRHGDRPGRDRDAGRAGLRGPDARFRGTGRLHAGGGAALAADGGNRRSDGGVMAMQGFGETRTAQAVDGCPIAYAIAAGRTDAPRVALIHSLALDRHFWGAVVAEAAGGFEMLALDCRGHGASGGTGPFTAPLMADDLAAVLDHAGWNRCLVAGASMGGSVALAFAARHHARTAGLLAVDTTAWYGPTAPEDWARRAGVARTGGMAALLEFQRARWLSDAFRADHPQVQAAQEAIFLRTGIEPYAAACGMLGALDLRAAIPGITAPTAVLVGEEDGATPPAMAEAIATGDSGATLEMLKGRAT